MYEHKCRDKEEADQNVNRNANTSNSKQIDKVEWKSATKDQRDDELWASFPAAPSCLPPFSCAARPYRRGRTRRKQVLCFLCSLALLFIFGRLCLCMRVNCNSAYCNENVTSCKKKKKWECVSEVHCWRQWHENHTDISLNRTLAFMHAIFIRCAWPADRSYQQNINTLAKAREDWIREHVSSCEVGKGSNGSKKKRNMKKWGDYPPPTTTTTTLYFKGVWKLGEGAHRLPEERRVDTPQPALPAVCDQRRGGCPSVPSVAEIHRSPNHPPPMLCSYTRRWGSRWSAATSRETSNTS